MKKGPYGRFAVDVDNGFDPYYVVDPDKRKKVADLKRLLKDADELYLATDEDREGEAIAWHLREVLKPTVPVRRMVFHEITREAIQAAVNQTRDIDMRWSTPRRPGGSWTGSTATRSARCSGARSARACRAGRVQSVATRLVVERERERMAFRAASYWDVVAEVAPEGDAARTSAPGWSQVDGSRVATGRDFTDAAELKTADVAHLDQAAATVDRRRPGARRRHGPLGAGEALHPPAGRAVHDLDPAAGGQPQAALLQQARDERGAAAVRERLHHLHAHRLDDAVRGRAERGPRPGPRAVRRPATCPTRRGATSARSRTRRRRTRRSARPVTGSVRRPRSRASCAARSSRSTS